MCFSQFHFCYCTLLLYVYPSFSSLVSSKVLLSTGITFSSFANMFILNIFIKNHFGFIYLFQLQNQFWFSLYAYISFSFISFLIPYVSSWYVPFLSSLFLFLRLLYFFRPQLLKCYIYISLCENLAKESKRFSETDAIFKMIAR